MKIRAVWHYVVLVVAGALLANLSVPASARASGVAQPKLKDAESTERVALPVSPAVPSVPSIKSPTPPSAREIQEDREPADIPLGFTSNFINVNGVELHYVEGGQGRPVILLHGFPQNWSAYARVMPELATKFRVISVDLRGVGRSEVTEKGFDSATLAEDIFQLVHHLGLANAYVVGHDLGGGVAYALARLHPESVRGIMLIEAAVPGIDPWDQILADPAQWPIRFHQASPLAERLLAGREAVYINYLLRHGVKQAESISDEDVVRYAKAYTGAGQITAAMNMFRMFPENERFGRQRRGPLDVEVTLVSGSDPVTSLVLYLERIADELIRAGTGLSMIHEIRNTGHFLLDERPYEISGYIMRQASKDNRETLPLRTGQYNIIPF